jgi:hypothetical protein
MRIVQSSRASAILYNILVRRADSRPWLLPANICPIVPIIFLKARVSFEFVDISAATFHIDLKQVENLFKTSKYGGLLYAHTYGELSTPEDFFATLKSMAHEIVIVDDRCLCIPDLKPMTTSADVILYSTGYAKIVDLNFGGYAFIHEDLAYQPSHLPFNSAHHDEIEKLYKEAVQQRKKFLYQDSDWLKIDASFPAWYDYSLQIEVGRNASLNHRSLLNQIYTSRLPKEIQLPQSFQTWRFNIRVKNKQQILDAIFNANLFASSHYASMAGIMADGFAPQAESLADEVVNLFNDEHFDEQKAQKTCNVILGKL